MKGGITMGKHGWILFGVTFVLGLFIVTAHVHALSPETEALLKLLEKKGIITNEEAASLRQEMEAGAPQALDKEAIKAEIKEEVTEELKSQGGPLAGLPDNIAISGAVEVDYRYADHRDRNDKNSDSTSDLYASTIELGVEVQVNESTTANIIFKLEDVDKSSGDESNVDDNDDKPVIDEATITIYNQEKCPFYAVLGKRAQPFGNFFTHTISDPITKDAYEIATTGATIGYAPADFYDLDVSLSLYKGEKLMDHVGEIGSGPGRSTGTGYTASDDVQSYIASLSLKPTEGLTLGVAFDSEPGDDSRNETLNAFAGFSMAALTLDAEYFAATKREKYAADYKTYKEKAWVIGLAYQLMEPLELAVRYEDFDNNRSADVDGDFDYTLAFGANYEILKNVTLMGEYRKLREKAAAGSDYEETVNEYNFRVAVGF